MSLKSSTLNVLCFIFDSATELDFESAEKAARLFESPLSVSPALRGALTIGLISCDRLPAMFLVADLGLCCAENLLSLPPIECNVDWGELQTESKVTFSDKLSHWSPSCSEQPVLAPILSFTSILSDKIWSSVESSRTVENFAFLKEKTKMGYFSSRVV